MAPPANQASSRPDINDKNYINILLLGETGVGKSTFINSFVNYISYKDFEVAMGDEPICVIPTKFTFYTHDYEEKNVSVGTDQNEFTDVGVSATQGTKSYVFPLGDGQHYLRIIDTPGIGDTRGIDQDKENFENILGFLSRFDRLHSICILLKPNSSRLTVMFEFCLKQLLCRLEKSAANNMMFIFTNSRSTFYRPGDTKPILEKLLLKIKEKPPHIRIPFGVNNIFCLDNEAYRFLIACKNKIEFSPQEVNEFSGSWIKSVDECIRLIIYIIGNEKQKPLEPHKIQDTLSVNEARRVIFMLSKPLADITQLIQDNKQIIINHRDKVETNKKHRKNLEGQLFLPCVNLREIELTNPVTVCTSDNCSTTVTVENKKMRDYTQRCHDPCGLQNVPKEIIGTPELAQCWAMDSSGRCHQCGCDFKIHMHIYYMTERYESTIEDKSIKDQLSKAKTDNEKYESYMKIVEQKLTELDFEHSHITKNLAKFAHFIKCSTILPFNDSVKDYIEYLINREEHLGPDGDKDLIVHYREMLLQYEEEKRLLEEAMSMSSDASGQINTQDVMSIVKDLFNLKHNGAQLKSLYEMQQKCSKQEHKENEEYFHSRTNNSSFLTYQQKKPGSYGYKSYSEVTRPQRPSEELRNYNYGHGNNNQNNKKKKKKNQKNKHEASPPSEHLGFKDSFMKNIRSFWSTEDEYVMPAFEEEFCIPKFMIEYAYGPQGRNIVEVYNIEGVSKVDITSETGRIKITGKTQMAVKEARLVLEYTTKVFNLVGELFTNQDHTTQEFLDKIKIKSGLMNIQIGEATDEYLPIICVGNIVNIAKARDYLEAHIIEGNGYHNYAHNREFKRQTTPKMEVDPNFSDSNNGDYDIERQSYEYQQSSSRKPSPSTGYEQFNSANFDKVGRGFANLNLLPNGPSPSMFKQPAKFNQQQYEYNDQILSNYSTNQKQSARTTNYSTQNNDKISRKIASFLVQNDGERVKQVLDQSGLDSIKINELNSYSEEFVQIQYFGSNEQINQAKHIIGFMDKFVVTGNGAVQRRIREQTFTKKFLLFEEQEKCTTEEIEVPKHLMCYSKGSIGQNLDKAKTVKGVIDITNEENKFIISATSKESIEAAKSILEFIEENIPISAEILDFLSSDNSVLSDMKEKTGAVKLELKAPKKKSAAELAAIKKVLELSSHESFSSLPVASRSVEPLSLPRQLVASLMSDDQVKLKSIMRITKIAEIKVIGDGEYKYPTVHVVLKGEPENVSKAKTLINLLGQLDEQMDINEAEAIDIKTNIFKVEQLDSEQPVVKAIGTANSVSQIKNYFAALKGLSRATLSEGVQLCKREIELPKHLFVESVEMNLEKVRNMAGILNVQVLDSKFIIQGIQTALEEACAILELKEEKTYIPVNVYHLLSEDCDILADIRNSTGIIDINIVGPKIRSPEEIVLIQTIVNQLSGVNFEQIEKCKAPKLCMSLPRSFVMKLLENNQLMIRSVADISRVKEIKIVGDNDEDLKFPIIHIVVIGEEDEITKAKYILEMLEKSNFVLRDEAAAETYTIPHVSIIPEGGDEKPCAIISGTKGAISDATNYLMKLSGGLQFNITASQPDEASDQLIEINGVEDLISIE